MKQVVALSLLVLGFFSTVCKAQQYNFISYSIEDGLAQSQVRSLLQDSRGYIWVGTLGGLSRFDGIEFTNYSTDNGLPGNQVNAIFEDSKGRIWAGCKGAIAHFEKGVWYVHQLDSSFSESIIFDIQEDGEGHLWLATDGRGSICYQEKECSYFNTENGLAHDYVRAITRMDDMLFFATRGGVSVMKAGKFIDGNEELAELNASDVVFDANKNCWVTTYGAGVVKVNGSTKQYKAEDGLIRNHIRNAIIDQHGALWFASKKGVSRLSDGVFTNFVAGEGIPNENIRVLLEDFDGNIWMGSDGGGLLKFSGEAFVSYSASPGLPSTTIMSMVEDTMGALWFSTYGSGVSRFYQGNFTNYDRKSGLTNNTVWASYCDTKGHLWFGTSEGVVKWDGTKFDSPKVLAPLKGMKVWSITEGDNGEMWFGILQGAARMKDDSLEAYLAGNVEIGENVRRILNYDEAIWFASATGLFKYRNGKFENVTEIHKLPTKTIYTVFASSKGKVWLGTDAGLILLKDQGHELYKLGADYGSNQVIFMSEDKLGSLWLGTNNGIVEFVNDEQLGHRIIRYGLEDGLVSLESNQNAAYTAGNGNLWFGMGSGLMNLRIDRRKRRESTRPPTVSILGLRLFQQEFNYDQYADGINEAGLPVNPVFPSNKNFVTFDYVGISHLKPDEVTYQYKLEGFDEDWLPVTKVRFATYSNLPFGEYTFLLKASNKDGVWTSDPVSFSFEITPPFYLTTWFIIGCVILFIILIIVIYRWRRSVAAEKERTQQLEYQSRLLSLEQQTLNASMNRHFIFNALNSIQYYINRQDRLAANSYLSSFAKLIRKNLDSSQSNNVLLSEELERLKLYLKLENMRFTDKFEYDLNIGEDVHPETLEIPAMLLQPYVENSIWHGILPKKEPGKIKIDVSRQNNDELLFVIEDNGIGIEQSKKMKGVSSSDHISQGMNITKNRLDLIRKMKKQNVFVNGPYELKEGGDVLGTRVEIGIVANSFN